MFVWLLSDSSFNLRDKGTEARSKQNAYCPVVSQGSHKSQMHLSLANDLLVLLASNNSFCVIMKQH